MSSHEMSSGYRGSRAVATMQQTEAAAHYRLVMAATLPAVAILLAATVMMTKLLLV